jgi:hypothetical protein
MTQKIDRSKYYIRGSEKITFETFDRDYIVEVTK